MKNDSEPNTNIYYFPADSPKILKNYQSLLYNFIITLFLNIEYFKIIMIFVKFRGILLRKSKIT